MDSINLLNNNNIIGGSVKLSWAKVLRHSLFGLLLTFMIYSPLSPQAAEHKDDPKVVAGWLEDIVIAPWGFKVRAKLDTGAKTSSIHAHDLERFERDGEPWVRFLTRDRRRNDGDRYVIERPMIRTTKIKRHGRSSKRRPVIELDFCLNRRVYTAEFTLTDRAGFNYPVLLGRSMLENKIIVDPSMTFTHKTHRKSCMRLVTNGSNEEDEQDINAQLDSSNDLE